MLLAVLCMTGCVKAATGSIAVSDTGPNVTLPPVQDTGSINPVLVALCVMEGFLLGVLVAVLCLLASTLSNKEKRHRRIDKRIADLMTDETTVYAGSNVQ